MKLVKAYVRTFIVHKVIEALKDIGAPRLSAIDVKNIGDEVDHENLEISGEYGSTYTTMVKIEIVCNDNCLDRIIELILKNARTGYKGDGVIAISPVEDIIRIRTGEKGERECRLRGSK